MRFISLSPHVPEEIKPVVSMDLRWKHPFTALVAGPSGSGKSYFVTRFIRNVNAMCDVTFDKIHWYRPSLVSGSDDYSEGVKFKNVQYRYGLPDPDEFDASGPPVLLVIDDMMRETGSTAAVMDLFTKGSHHRNLSVFYMTQNLFHQGRGQRDISLNAHYIVCFKNPRDRAQIRYLAQQMYPDNVKFIEEAYADATREPHGYLLLDLKQTTADNMRVRTRVFPDDEYQYAYEPKLKSRK